MKLLKTMTAAALIFLVPALCYAAPKMIFENDQVVLDQPVLEGQQIKGVFVVINQGDSELNILRVSPG